MNISAQMARITSARRLLNAARRCCSGESRDSTPLNSSAIPPISVSVPVATTRPLPRPRVTRVLR
jgi:hypothetical protein